MFAQNSIFFKFLKHRSILKRSYCSTKKDLVIVEKVRQTTLIGINRPEKRNCINHETAKALYNAFKEFDEDDDAFSAVLYGVGGNFCAGYDLTGISEDTQKVEQVIKDVKEIPGFGPMGPTFLECKKPVIAAVEGYCVAGGLELALWCDLRYAEETACLGFLNRRFGVPLIDGGTVRLPAIIGMGRAMEMILMGTTVDGKEAYNIGLVNGATETGTAIGKAFNTAQSMKKYPKECIYRDKGLVYQSVFGSTSMRQALENELNNVSPEVLKEASIGAKRFQDGIGRHGSSSLDSYDDITKDLDVLIDK